MEKSKYCSNPQKGVSNFLEITDKFPCSQFAEKYLSVSFLMTYLNSSKRKIFFLRIGDSCVQQVISITHEIYKAFDCSPSLEVRRVFLDISKAFDKVWHDGLLYKLKHNGINGDLLKLIESFLSDRYQRVVLHG